MNDTPRYMYVGPAHGMDLPKRMLNRKHGNNVSILHVRGLEQICGRDARWFAGIMFHPFWIRSVQHTDELEPWVMMLFEGSFSEIPRYDPWTEYQVSTIRDNLSGKAKP